MGLYTIRIDQRPVLVMRTGAAVPPMQDRLTTGAALKEAERTSDLQEIGEALDTWLGEECAPYS